MVIQYSFMTFLLMKSFKTAVVFELNILPFGFSVKQDIELRRVYTSL